MTRHRPIACLLAIALPLLLAGCGGRPMRFPTPDTELDNRPGLLTGKTGAWQILSPSGRPQQSE